MKWPRYLECGLETLHYEHDPDGCPFITKIVLKRTGSEKEEVLHPQNGRIDMSPGCSSKMSDSSEWSIEDIQNLPMSHQDGKLLLD